MKLKYLFKNFDLAEMIVKNWDYDNLEYFKYFRISSNAIYPFSNQGKVYFLRISPIDEKSEKNMLAELEFLGYLRDNNYAATQAKPSKNGRELEIVNTPWGWYYAAVFPRVRGKALGDIEITDDITLQWGRALGKLHRLSREYKPAISRRNTWKDQLEWIKRLLKELPDETDAMREADKLTEIFQTIPVTEDNYGLVHYDFESDNIFYDRDTNEIIPIDFDDSMYHWYVMDVEQVLDNIKNELSGERAEEVSKIFLKGYNCEYSVSEEAIEQLPVFRRFANLYAHARVLRSLGEKWDNEPECLTALRVKLNDRLDKNRQAWEQD